MKRERTGFVDDFTVVEEDGAASVEIEHSTWAPTIPSIGIRWEF